NNDEEIAHLKQQLEQYQKDNIQFNSAKQTTLVEMEKLKKISNQKIFVYGILITTNKFNHSMGIQVLCIVGRYLCSGSDDNTICLWDVETSKSLHVFNGHEDTVWCVDISPLQNNNRNDNNIGVISGNGYTVYSGSGDNTIRIWDIETTKQLNVFKGHENWIMSVKYGSNELLNTIYLDHMIT
ncbi:WD-40 repeat protein, partial [Reticulomyxa filosa]